MKTKRLLSLLAAAILSLGLFTSCNNEGDYDYDDDDEDEIEEKDEKKEETEKKKKKKIEYRSPLTGLETTKELSEQRPVAIMFNNLKASLPQHGIGDMEIVYEALVEGKITRLLGVTTDWESLGELGSIRSSRDYYIDLADAHNAIYVHAGASDIAYNVLAERETDNIDGTNGNSDSQDAFYRNKERKKNGVATEHTLFTSGEDLSEAIKNNEYETTLDEEFISPLSFSEIDEEQDGDDAEYIYIPFSTYAQSYFDFNKKTGTYDKGQYLSSKTSYDEHDSPHIDGNTGEQLAFENVIVLFVEHKTIDNEGRQAFDFVGEGEGYYFCNGKAREIEWSKENRTECYILFEEGGRREVKLNPGKSYIALVSPETEVEFE